MDRRLIPLWVLVIAFAALVSIGQKLRSSGNFSHVIIKTSDDLTISFLRMHQGSHQACNDVASSFATAITAKCPSCQLVYQGCLKNLTPEQHTLFDETPLGYPSARIPNGIITFHSTDPKLAQAACEESRQQSQRNKDEHRVDCQHANQPRPLPLHLKQAHGATETLFHRISQVLASLGLGLAAYLTAQWLRKRATPSPRLGAPPSLGYWTHKITLSSVDALILLGTFVTISWPKVLETGGISSIEYSTLISYAGLIALTILWFWTLLEHYARRRPFWDELREISRVIATMFIISGAVIFIAGLDGSRSTHVWVWVLDLILLPIGRSAARGLLDKLGLWKVHAIIIGAGENAREAHQALQSEPAMGYDILAFLDVESAQSTGNTTATCANLLATGIDDISSDSREQSPPVITCDSPQPAQIEHLLERLHKPQVIVALDSLSPLENQLLVQRLSASQHNMHIIPAIRGLPLFGTKASHFFSHEVLFLTVRNNLARRSYRLLKRAFDLLVASSLLLLLLPLFVALSALIRQGGATAFYSHPRVGKGGKSFKCFKFRSMRPDADEVLQELLKNNPASRAEWEKDFKLKNDPRITPIGHFLRKTSLDELPQLINVIKGEMSLVGPRPIIKAELDRYSEQAAYYLQVRPGITGLWQISGRNDTTYAERVALDAWYVKNWSLWYDIAILFKTAGSVVNRRGAY